MRLNPQYTPNCPPARHAGDRRVEASVQEAVVGDGTNFPTVVRLSPLGCWGQRSNRIQTAPVPDLAFHVRRLGLELAQVLDDDWHLGSRSGVNLIFGISTPLFSPPPEKVSQHYFCRARPCPGLFCKIRPTARSMLTALTRDRGELGSNFGIEDMVGLRHGQSGDRSFAAPYSQNTGLLSPVRRLATSSFGLCSSSPGAQVLPNGRQCQSHSPGRMGWVELELSHCPKVGAKTESANDWPAPQ
ncbi:hypothetical protein QBC39DRAFT_77894 [Podospora conica]|nr:hypothetical protein QBC39DRAFT_77894 [Schizothecium conicum]